MLKHEPSAINGLIVAAMAPIRVYWHELSAISALLKMPMTRLVIGVDNAVATVTPNDEQIPRFWIHFASHRFPFYFARQLNCTFHHNHWCSLHFLWKSVVISTKNEGKSGLYYLPV
jgi:hypothetical protein